MTHRAMTHLELLLGIIFVWLSAWLANVISDATGMPLFIASAILVTGYVLIVWLGHTVRTSRKHNEPPAEDQQDQTERE